MVDGGSVSLTVRDVIKETHDACSVVFDVPEPCAARFDYRPGQFLTLRIPGPSGDSVARCYSLASAPGIDAHLKVTVKRVTGGYASNWICDKIAPGHLIEVLPPAGTFTPQPSLQNLLMFAGGSGITPMMSIIKAMLARDDGTVVLIYANRDESSVIFAQELRDLAAAAPHRLQVIHVLESVVGQPTPQSLTALTRPYAQRDAAYICGPEPFMEAVTKALNNLGVPRERIVMEKFLSLTGNPFAERQVETRGNDDDAADQALAVVTLDSATHKVRWPRDMTLLDALLAAGVDAPYSCREGECSACSCRLVSGEVRMLRNEILDEEDLDEGWVLGCQTVAVSDEAELTFDD